MYLPLMGVSQRTTGTRLPAAVLSSSPPAVRVEEAADGGEESVLLEGVMFHDGLNKNAWGLSEAGAEEIASDLLGDDLVAAHPFVRNGQYDRSMTDGPGFPIGTVTSTEVVSVDEAMVDGGEYTARYTAEVTDPLYASRYANGQYEGDGFSVSVGIYGDPDAASCSVCGEQMASDDCGHERFDEVEVETADGDTETQLAGPVYDSGESDHLASVYMPAYEGATADVSTSSVSGETPAGAAQRGGLEAASEQSGTQVPAAAAVLAEPFDSASETEAASTESDVDTGEESESASDTDPQRGYRVRLAEDRSSSDPRNSFEVQL